MLTCLLIGTAYSEPLPSKPYKVCPQVVKAKDTPCRVQGPEAAIVVRNVERRESDAEFENKELKRIIEQLIEKIKELEIRLDQPRPG